MLNKANTEQRSALRRQRREAIRDRFLATKNLAEVAREYGISRGRVRQVVNSFNLEYEPQQERFRPSLEIERSIYDAVSNFINENGYSPSIREVADICGYPGLSTVQAGLVRLRSKGLVQWKEGTARSYRIVGEWVEQ